MRTVTIATRGSRLALWQARHVADALSASAPGLAVELLVVKTKGDKILDVPLSQIGGKALFVKEIEEALLDGTADLAVHSVKDVPMVLPKGLVLGCVPEREACTDCLCSERYGSVAELPSGARVGTSSLRRQALLLAKRPDLEVVSLRGNVDTRLSKMKEGLFDAVLLATAGLRRLGLTASRMAELDPQEFVPAVGQGALGVECRADDAEILGLLAPLEHAPTRTCVEAERAFLRALDGGCQVPIGARAVMTGYGILMDAVVAECDGSRVVRQRMVDLKSEPVSLGEGMAEELLRDGAKAILDRLRG